MILWYTYWSHFVHPFTGAECAGCFRLLAVSNDAAANMRVQTPLGDPASHAPRSAADVWLLRPAVIPFVSFRGAATLFSIATHLEPFHHSLRDPNMHRGVAVTALDSRLT